MRACASRFVAFGWGMASAVLIAIPVLAARHPGWPPWRTEGYEWGRLNCGHHGTYRIRNRAGCEKCCNLGARNESYPGGETQDCLRICSRAVWVYGQRQPDDWSGEPAGVE